MVTRELRHGHGLLPDLLAQRGQPGVLVAELVGELPHHLPGSRQSCRIDARGCHDHCRASASQRLMTMSNQLAHALVYQVTVCQSRHGPCASLLGVLV